MAAHAGTIQLALLIGRQRLVQGFKGWALGLDIGQALSPLVFGTLMDHQRYSSVFIGLALVQAVLIASAFNVKKARRTVVATA